MARVYATAADLANYGAPDGVTLPTGTEATRQLTRASEVLDSEALFAAVYDTDAGGLPTDPAIVTALRDAVCAQVVWWADGGASETGSSDQWDDVQAGGIRLSRSRNSAPTHRSRLAPQAITHLRVAVDAAGRALLPGVVFTGC